MAKLAVMGKGGAGKTMVVSTLAYMFARRGDDVCAIDADPNPTLGMALGFPEDLIASVQPIRSLRDIIARRTGTGSAAAGSFFRLNPKVDDLPHTFSTMHRSIRLMIMGATASPGGGCACAENTLVKALVSHMVLGTGETVLLDMVAGTEHLGRGTAMGVDAMLLVVEPAARSISAARSVTALLDDAGAHAKCRIIANKITGPQDVDRIGRAFPEFPMVAGVSWRGEIIAAENDGVPVFDRVEETVEELEPILKLSS